MTILVIVESPSKCKIIEGYLGNNYKVVATCGHFRTLNDLSQISETMDIKFTVTKPKIIKMLKEEIKYSSSVIIATDDDREGESIAWHICNTCNISLDVPRIIFHEITKDSLIYSISNPTIINMNMVYSQQCRQILDLYIGYTISPLLWKYIQHKLSAGRCQTPALKLLYDKEKLIEEQTFETNYKVTGIFSNNLIEFKLSTYLDKTNVEPFLELCKNYTYVVTKKEGKEVESSPPSILITSTLQQRASQLLNLSPKSTMMSAQILYENGLITYMRTDTPSYSNDFINKVNKFISFQYGDEYIGEPSNKEGTHEGIRITNLDIVKVNFEPSVNRLYEFIYKQTLQSCMSKSKSINTNYDIQVPMDLTMTYVSIQNKFNGFKIIKEINQNSISINRIDWGNYLNYVSAIKFVKIIAKEQIQNIQLHYTEAQLINKLEYLGIGRPSTYTSILDSIEKYVIKGRVETTKIQLNTFSLKNMEITNIYEEKLIEEKNKIKINDIGRNVIEFCYKYFNDIFRYDYTISMENFLDKVATGIEWRENIKQNINKIKEYNTIDIQEIKPEYNSIHCGLYKGDAVIIKNGPHGYYIKYKNECASLSQYIGNIEDLISSQEITDQQLLSLVHYMQNKNTTIIYIFSPDISIRKSNKGYYVYYKTSKMKKPKFFNIPNHLINDVEQIKEYIGKKYKLVY